VVCVMSVYVRACACVAARPGHVVICPRTTRFARGQLFTMLDLAATMLLAACHPATPIFVVASM